MNKVIITSKGAPLKDYLRDLIHYKQLLWALTYRNLRSKYAQTVIGLFWTVINPVFSLLILGFIFGKVAKLDTHGIDPFLFTMIGLTAWVYFSNVVSGAGRSIVSSQSMIKKIYFPRLLLPLSVAITALLDLVIVLVLTTILLVLNRYIPSQNLVYFPFFLILIVLLGAVGGIWVSALSIRYRDFHHIVPFFLRMGLYASPVAYALDAVEEKFHWIFALNPLTGILEGFRWCFFGGVFPGPPLLISIIWLTFLFFIGLFIFHRIEKNMADII